MKDVDLVKIGEAFERLLRSPDFGVLRGYIQSQIQITSSQILQGNFTEFPKAYWVLVGKLQGLASAEGCMTATIKAMQRVKKRKEEERGKK